MQISIIAAIGENNELGANNELLWHLPIDFKWFIAKTKGKPVIMGRKTMESLGKPLKNRQNIVLSKQLKEVPEGFILVKNLDDALKTAEKYTNEEIMIIGGAQIYEQGIKFANKLYITHVNGVFQQADTFFPEIVMSQYNLIFEESHSMDDEHLFDYRFCIYEKIES